MCTRPFLRQAKTRTRTFTHTHFSLSLCSITCEQVHTEIACGVLFQIPPYFTPVQQPVAALKETETQVKDLLTVNCIDNDTFSSVTVSLDSTVPSSPCGSCFEVYPRCGGSKWRQGEMLHEHHYLDIGCL